MTPAPWQVAWITGAGSGIGRAAAAGVAREGVITASVAGYRGMPRNSAYAPTMAALIDLAECLYPDLSRFGVKMSVINPGYVDTPMTRGNKAPMPFLINADAAGRHIIKGLKRGQFEIAFPWQIAWSLKFARILPYWLYFWALRRFGMSPR